MSKINFLDWLMVRLIFRSGIALFILLMAGCQSVEKDDAANFFLKGNTQLAKNNYAEAIRLYDEALQKYPKFADAQMNKGLALLQTGQPEAAYQAFSAALTSDQDLSPAYLARAEAASRLGRWQEALSDLEQIGSTYADSSHYQLILGNAHAGRTEESAALAAYDRSIMLDSKNVEAHVNRGALYYGQGNYPLATRDFELALSLNPRQVQALNNLGLLAARAKAWDKALGYFDKALAIDGVDALSLNNKGYVLLQTGKYAEAKELISRSLKNLPENAHALRNMALVYAKTNDLKNAITYYNQALELAQPVDLLHGYAGEAYLASGDRSKACDLWKSGIMLADSLAKDNYEKFCR